jgi:hypothetical protein
LCGDATMRATGCRCQWRRRSNLKLRWNEALSRFKIAGAIKAVSGVMDVQTL